MLGCYDRKQEHYNTLNDVCLTWSNKDMASSFLREIDWASNILHFKGLGIEQNVADGILCNIEITDYLTLFWVARIRWSLISPKFKYSLKSNNKKQETLTSVYVLGEVYTKKEILWIPK